MITEAAAIQPRTPICIRLSVALPIINGLIVYTCIDGIMNSWPALISWGLISTPVWGLLLAVIGWLRGERSIALFWTGLVLNSSILATIIYALSHLQFGC